MDKNLAARNVRLGALLFLVALVMFGFSFLFAFVFLKGNEAAGESAVASPTPVSGQTPVPAETPAVEGTPSAGETPAAAGEVIDIKAVPAIRFDQSELTAQAGGTVTVRFDNEDGGVPHNWALYIDDSASEAIAGANEGICTGPCSDDITFELPAPGEYFFRCDVHPTQMTGTFIVR